MPHFQSLWQRAFDEKSPDPQGAAGQLMAAVGELLEVPQVEYAKIGEVALFLLDLSALGFRGMDFDVVMVSHPPHGEEAIRTQAKLLSDYRDALKSDGLCFRVLLSWDLPQDDTLATDSSRAVLICGRDLERLFSSNIPQSALFEIIRRQIPLQRLCPFNTTQAARGSMFRGRRTELEQLTGDLRTDFVLRGARRIGKTSLLWRASDMLRIRPEFRDRVHLFNCLTWGGTIDCSHRLSHEIDKKREPRIELGRRNISYLLERKSARGTRPLFLFFDEMDRVVERDEANSWEFFNILAEAAGQRWIRVVFAGYREMARLISGPRSPFYNALRDVELTPLNQSECSALISAPFSSVEIKIKQEDTLTERIWKGSAGHPFLTQFYGEILFRRASNRDPQEIDLNDIQEIEEGFEIIDFLLDHFLDNTLSHGKPIAAERICCFLLAHAGDRQEWSRRDFHLAVDNHDQSLTADEVHNALKNLVRASILSFQRNRYTFAFPLLSKVIRESYPELDILLRSRQGR